MQSLLCSVSYCNNHTRNWQGYVDSKMNHIHVKIVCRYVYQMSDSKTHMNQMQCTLYFRCVCFGFLLKGSI